jgi:hypothetical protein
MRLFIAILIPPDVMQQLGRLQAQLKAQLPDPSLRWVAPDNFHFTLLFLGEQPEARLPAIEQAMQVAARQARHPSRWSYRRAGCLSRIGAALRCCGWVRRQAQNRWGKWLQCWNSSWSARQINRSTPM